jgi:hypothetical protein
MSEYSSFIYVNSTTFIIEINNKYEYESMSKLDFQPITEDFVSKRISKINVKKATGIDGISPRLLHPL